MTYAGLMRKAPTSPSAPPTSTPAAPVVQRRGLLKFSSTDQEDLVYKLVGGLNRTDVEREIAGTP